jgi:hypothetical protein
MKKRENGARREGGREGGAFIGGVPLNIPPIIILCSIFILL